MLWKISYDATLEFFFFLLSRGFFLYSARATIMESLRHHSLSYPALPPYTNCTRKNFPYSSPHISILSPQKNRACVEKKKQKPEDKRRHTRKNSTVFPTYIRSYKTRLQSSAIFYSPYILHNIVRRYS